jgi:hypothetical protein
MLIERAANLCWQRTSVGCAQSLRRQPVRGCPSPNSGRRLSSKCMPSALSRSRRLNNLPSKDDEARYGSSVSEGFASTSPAMQKLVQLPGIMTANFFFNVMVRSRGSLLPLPIVLQYSPFPHIPGVIPPAPTYPMAPCKHCHVEPSKFVWHASEGLARCQARHLTAYLATTARRQRMKLEIPRMRLLRTKQSLEPLAAKFLAQKSAER